MGIITMGSTQIFPLNSALMQWRGKGWGVEVGGGGGVAAAWTAVQY